MKSETNKLTLAAIAVFLVLLCAGGLGFCGRPSDHQPKPNPSSSVKGEQPKAPVPTTSPTKVRR